MSNALEIYNRGLWAGVQLSLFALEPDAPANLRKLYEEISSTHAEADQMLLSEATAMAMIHLLAEPDDVGGLAVAITRAVEEAGLTLVHTEDAQERGELHLSFSRGST